MTLNETYFKEASSLVDRLFIPQNASDIRLIDKNNLDKINWPSSSAAQYTKAFFTPFLEKGIDKFISNIHGELYLLQAGEKILPILVPDARQTNSYVCSPYAHYISYGQDSMDIIENNFLAESTIRLLGWLGNFLKKGNIDSVIYVNHWGASTDFYPEDLSFDELGKILSFLKQKFPERAILFRSLNPVLNGGLLKSLKKLHCNMVSTRQIFMTHTDKEAIFQTRIVKSDLKLYRETAYQIEHRDHLTEQEGKDILELYSLLYLKGHSYVNPQFTQAFVEHMQGKQLLKFILLKNKNRILGMAGYFEREGLMMCPFFGYNKQDSDTNTIYRLLSTALLVKAREKKLLFHQSTGASFYKKLRRAESCMEFMAVYTEHLPFKQKLTWNLLIPTINLFAPYFMSKI